MQERMWLAMVAAGAWWHWQVEPLAHAWLGANQWAPGKLHAAVVLAAPVACLEHSPAARLATALSCPQVGPHAWPHPRPHGAAARSFWGAGGRGHSDAHTAVVGAQQRAGRALAPAGPSDHAGQQLPCRCEAPGQAAAGAGGGGVACACVRACVPGGEGRQAAIWRARQQPRHQANHLALPPAAHPAPAWRAPQEDYRLVLPYHGGTFTREQALRTVESWPSAPLGPCGHQESEAAPAGTQQAEGVVKEGASAGAVGDVVGSGTRPAGGKGAAEEGGSAVME